MTSSLARWQPLGVGGHLLSSLEPAWRPGAQTLSLRKTISALDAAEGNPHSLRRRRPLLSPEAVLSAMVIHEVGRGPTCGMQRKCGKCRVFGAGQVSRKHSRSAPADLEIDTRASPPHQGTEKTRTHNTLAQDTPLHGT